MKTNDSDNIGHLVLTKQEYFTGLAMQGILAGGYDCGNGGCSTGDLSSYSWRIAEDLLQEFKSREEDEREQ